jgi:hypothetical protein
MKKRGLLTGILGLTMLGMVFTACESNSPVSLEESLKDTPNVKLIDGASDATVTVNRNNSQSYFTVEIDNLLPESGIDNGFYNAWCVLYDTPINSNGGNYQGVKLHSVEADVALQRVQYIVNNKNRFMHDINADWKDIQVAIWSVLDFPKLDYMSELGNLPADFRQNGQPTFNTSNVDAIVSSAIAGASQNNGPCKVYLIETEHGQQNIVIESCDTATARMNNDPDDDTFALAPYVNGNNWWSYVTFPRANNDESPTGDDPVCDAGYETYFMYAGQTNYAGLFCIKRDGDGLTYYYDFDEFYPTETHTLIVTSTASLIANPGGFTSNLNFSDPVQKTDPVTVSDPGGTLYIVAHAAGGFGTIE